MRSDLPFACRGGVCGTCRAKLVEGTVAMDVNYALEPEEIERRLRPHLPVAPDLGTRRPRLRRVRMAVRRVRPDSVGPEPGSTGSARAAAGRSSPGSWAAA